MASETWSLYNFFSTIVRGIYTSIGVVMRRVEQNQNIRDLVGMALSDRLGGEEKSTLSSSHCGRWEMIKGRDMEMKMGEWKGKGKGKMRGKETEERGNGMITCIYSRIENEI